jgi:hypothetical protein
VRLAPASDAERTAVTEAARRVLGDVTIDSIDLSRNGFEVHGFTISGAHAPSVPPATEEQAEAAARSALTRYWRVFGDEAADFPRAELRARRDSLGLVAWSVEGTRRGNTGRAARFHVGLEPSGAVRYVKRKNLSREPPPGSLCEAGLIALDDGRIRTAIIGASATYYTIASKPITQTFREQDIGTISSFIWEEEFEVYSRVIKVELANGLFIALLDPDNGALISITPTIVS